MFTKIKNEFVSSLVNSLLTKYETEELDAKKRLISVIAGIYILQKGIRNIRDQHFIAAEQIILGGILLYSAAAGLHKKIIKQPIKPSDIRKNQIQGNDPRSEVPAFV